MLRATVFVVFSENASTESDNAQKIQTRKEIILEPNFCLIVDRGSNRGDWKLCLSLSAYWMRIILAQLLFDCGAKRGDRKLFAFPICLLCERFVKQVLKLNALGSTKIFTRAWFLFFGVFSLLWVLHALFPIFGLFLFFSDFFVPPPPPRCLLDCTR